MVIVEVTKAMADQAIRNTDWVAQDALTDPEIAQRVADDPDAVPILTASKTAAALVRTVRNRLGISPGGLRRPL